MWTTHVIDQMHLLGQSRIKVRECKNLRTGALRVLRVMTHIVVADGNLLPRVAAHVVVADGRRNRPLDVVISRFAVHVEETLCCVAGPDLSSTTRKIFKVGLRASGEVLVVQPNTP
jgi:hypothetical protein